MKQDSATPANNNEPYLDWLNYIFAQKHIPQTISTSYGDDEQTVAIENFCRSIHLNIVTQVPRDYATRVCNMFAALGARGTTLFFSTGDYG